MIRRNCVCALVRPLRFDKLLLDAQYRPRRCISSQRVAPQPLDARQVEEVLSKPTWSVTALLPTEEQIEASEEVSSEQIHHILRLCALPKPETPDREAAILRDLKAQLHFVKEIQKVDTTNVKPLRAIRDETLAAQKENEMNLDMLKEALEDEEVIGKYHKRIRRRRSTKHEAIDSESWDVLNQAPKKVGRYIVVESVERGS